MPDWINPEPQNPEPATDLEWMLRSSLVSSEVLAETLLSEYYTDIARLCLELTGDTEQVPAIVCQTITQAVLQRHAFREVISAKTWLLELAETQITRRARHKAKLDPKTLLAKTLKPVTQEAANPPFDLQIPSLTDQRTMEYLSSIQLQIKREKKGSLFAEKGKEMLLAGIVLAVIFLLGQL